MGSSALGKTITIDDRVSASATDNSPDFLDAKVDAASITVVGNQLVRGQLTGNVTAPSGSNTTTIANDVVTVGMIADGTDGELITWDAAGEAVTVDVGTVDQVLTSGGTGVAPTFQDAGGGGGIPTNIQTFTSSGTWTKPAEVSTVFVEVWGRGGAGGTAVTTDSGGGGGGGGGYSSGLIAVSGNVTVTIGATCSFAGDVTIQATSGTTGGASGGAGGVGGVGSNGTTNLTGSTGGKGSGGDQLAHSGVGGGAPMGAQGAGGVMAASSTFVNGTAGTSPGGAGSGGARQGGSNGTGGTGAAGLVIVSY